MSVGWPSIRHEVAKADYVRFVDEDFGLEILQGQLRDELAAPATRS